MPAPPTNVTWRSRRAAGTEPKQRPRCDERPAVHA